MGRYYTGDINGKFWFGLQSSDAASRFGGTEQQPTYITYSFEKDEDLEGVEEEIKSIQESLGDKINVIEDFFKKHDSYNDEMLREVSISDDELRDYADLLLGIQIRDCLIEQGYCTFDAEY